MDMSSVEIILVRHGQTVENRSGILQGHLPGRLTREGRLQAEELACRLAGERFSAVVCSDLARSYDTAVIIASPAKLVPVSTPLLREMDWGCYTGRKGDEARLMGSDASVETASQMYVRAGKFLEYLCRNYRGSRVVVVGHGCFNRAIIARVAGTGPEGMGNIPLMDNAGFVELSYAAGV